MKENTIILLYDPDEPATQPFAEPELGEATAHLWEYIDKDRFPIMISNNKRESTDIQVSSSARDRVRPQSASMVYKSPQNSVQGILIRRSNSLSRIDDLLLVRKGPLIKPLLSEREIVRLQQLQEECRKKYWLHERRSVSLEGRGPTDIIQETGLDQRDLEGSEVEYARREDGPTGIVSPFAFKGKTKYSPDVSDKIDKAGKMVYSKTQKDQNKKEDINKKLGKINTASQQEKEASKAIKPQKDKKGGGKDKIMDKEVYDGKKGTGKQPKPIITTQDKKVRGNNKDNKDYTEYEKENIHSERQNKTKKGDNTSKRKKSQQETEHKDKASKSQKGQPETESVTKNRVKTNFNDPDKKSGKGASKRQSKSSIDERKNAKNGKHTKNNLSPAKEPATKYDKAGKEVKTDDSGGNAKSYKSSKGKLDKSDYASDESVKTSSKIPKKKISDVDKYLESSTNKSLKDKTNKDKRHLEEVGLSDETSTKPSHGKDKSTKQKVTSGEDKSRRSSVHLSITLLKNKYKDILRKRSRRSSSELQYIIHYVLSNPLFIDLGWTLHAADRTLTRVVTFKATPTNPLFYCFREREEPELKLYLSGEIAVKIEQDGTGTVYYPSGSPAMVTTRNTTGMRLTLYSNPKKDPLIKESHQARIIGMFDSFGNGVVYNLHGKRILNYNQLEGVYNNPARTTPYRWQWRDYKILEKQRTKELLKSMVGEQKLPPAPKVPGKKGLSPPEKSVVERKATVDKEYEQMLSELPHPLPKKSKMKNVNHCANGFRSIVLKINEAMTLRINGQDNISVYFSVEKTFFRHDLGVCVDPETVERVENLAPDKLDEVPCVFESLQNLSPSLQHLNKQLARDTKYRPKSHKRRRPTN